MSETAERTTERSRIVVIDDQLTNTTLLERRLHRAGYEDVVCTPDAGWALASYADLDPDLILLDLHMPKLDGFAVLSELARVIPPTTTSRSSCSPPTTTWRPSSGRCPSARRTS